MPARIVEGADHAVTPAHDQQRIVADLKRDIVARARDFAVVADEQPLAGEQPLDLDPVEGRIGVEPSRQRMAVAPLEQRVAHFRLKIHL